MVLCCDVVFAIVLSVLAGWWLGIASLRNVTPSGLPMMPNTAVALALAAAALYVGRSGSRRRERVRRWIVRVCGAAVVLLGAVVLVEYLTKWNPGLNRILFRPALEAAGGPFPGRASHYVAAALVLLGCGLLGLHATGRPHRFSQFLALAGGLVAGLGLVGHIVRYDPFYRTSATSGMAVHTGIALLLVSVATLLARPQEGLVKLLLSADAGGLAARQLLPLPLLLTLVLSGLGLAGGRAGLYDRFIGVWLLQLTTIVVYSLLIWITAEQIHSTDQERRRAEQRLHERTAELETLNRELDAFSYSVSHDLRAPLRAVSGYSHALLEDYGPQLAGEAQDYLHSIAGGAQRMGKLIDDLLAFSRLARKGIAPVEINMAELARSVFEELRRATPERRLECRLQPLPPARGDRAMIRQVLVNLLSNAIKFTTATDAAQIEVGCSGNGSEQNTYYVRDNGAGFDMRYVDKLFGVFQRLHSTEEFEGTGVGLAIVQRVVGRHGGRVWAEGKVQEGATFHFTLPAEVKEP